MAQNEKCLQADVSTYEGGDNDFDGFSRSTQQILLGCSIQTMETSTFAVILGLTAPVPR